MLNLSIMAALVSFVSPVPSMRFALLCAAASSAFSTILLRAYIVGPTIGALSNRVAAMPLGAAMASLLALRLLPKGPLAHAVTTLLPLISAGAAAGTTRALERLEARFIYTEEAKGLQTS